MKNLIVVILALTCSFFLCACSTILNSTTQEIELSTKPMNAKITIDGNKFGTTPQVVNIRRGQDHVIKFELDGYEVYETQITRKMSLYFWLNVSNGLLPGMVIDLFTGSLYDLLPSKFEAELTPAKVVAPPTKKK